MVRSKSVLQQLRTRTEFTRSKSLETPRLLFVVNDPAFFLSHRLVIARAARLAGFAVFVATPQGAGVEKIREQGFIHVPIKLERWGMNPFKEFTSLLTLYRAYSKIKPHIVHHVTIKPVLYGSCIARIARIPAVVNAISGLGYVFISRGILATARRLCVQAIYRSVLRHRNSTVLFQNPDDRDFFVSNRLVAPGDFVMVKGSGVDTTKFIPFDSNNEIPVVLMVARLLRDKGLVEFVEAARLLRHKGVEARFLVAGDPATGNPAGVSEAQLAVWQEEGVVEFLGYCGSILPVYQSSDIICLPSYREGLPKALIEGASVGRPLVATDVPGCREVVREGVNGFLVALGDSAGLARALECLITDKSLRLKMGSMSRELVLREGFGEEYVVAATISVYRKLLEPLGLQIKSATEDKATPGLEYLH